MKKVLLAGATGYLGQHIARALIRAQWPTVLLARNPQKIQHLSAPCTTIRQAEVTQARSLGGCMDAVEVVISTVGITRQRDGLTYMDVDYQANMNLLAEAQRVGVQKFVYVSAINGQHLRHLKIFEAKERFVDQLKVSGLAYTIMRPNGFFSDMGDFLDMAKSGRVYLFGHGHARLNPIHGADLAGVCLQAVKEAQTEVVVGGPDVYSQTEVAHLALEAWGRAPRIVHLPDWSRRLVLFLLRTFSSSKTYGPIEFFLTAMTMNNVAPRAGTHRLSEYFQEKVRQEKAEKVST